MDYKFNPFSPELLSWNKINRRNKHADPNTIHSRLEGHSMEISMLSVFRMFVHEQQNERKA